MGNSAFEPADVEVDIIISTYGRGASIDETISSIRANTHQHFTLWVLDQSEDDQTQHCVQRHAIADARVRYSRVPLRGLCATRNSGSKLGSAPHILFTNDDIRVSPTWIVELRTALVQQQACTVFGQVLADPTSVGAGRHNQVVLGIKDTPTLLRFERNWFNLGFGHGHSMGVTRTSFEQLHGFDELLGAGALLGAWDDRDYGYRVLIRGGRIIYTPHAIAYHRHWQDWQGVRRSYASYGRGAGAAVAKYVRCGNPAAIALLAEWIGSQGLRQIGSGALKHRNLQTVRTGFSQIYYPIVGFVRGLRHPVDCSTIRYTSEQSGEVAALGQQSPVLDAIKRGANMERR